MSANVDTTVRQVLPFLQLLQRAGRWELRAPGIRGKWEMGNGCPSALPFTGWLGWLGYDVAWEIERLPYLKKDPLPFPVAFWYEPECFAVLDHWENFCG